jgi:hypothetical protein
MAGGVDGRVMALAQVTNSVTTSVTNSAATSLCGDPASVEAAGQGGCRPVPSGRDWCPCSAQPGRWQHPYRAPVCTLGMRSPRGAPVRVVWTKDTRRNPDGGGLLMSQPPVDPTLPSRCGRPGRLATNASAPAVGAPSSVGPAQRRQSVDASAGMGRRSRGRSERTAPPGAASTPSPRRSSPAAANHARFGVRRPIRASMPANRREQAIAALAQLLIVQLERQRRQPDPDIQGRGRVAASSSEQGEES